MPAAAGPQGLDALDRELFEMIEDEQARQRRSRHLSVLTVVAIAAGVVIVAAGSVASFGWLWTIVAVYVVSVLGCGAVFAHDARLARRDAEAEEPG